MRRAHRVLLIALVAAVFAARLAVFDHVEAVRPASIVASDSATYEAPAQALLQRGRFSISADAPNDPDTLRTPGYPIFIALVERFSGPGRRAVIQVQIALSVLTLLLLYGCARRLWHNETAALLAAALVALDPATFYYSQMVLTETLFTLLVVCALYCGCRVASQGVRRPRWVWLFGLSLALAAQVRPIVYYLIVPAELWLWLSLRRPEVSWNRAARWAAAGAVPWLLLVGGWQVRNRILTGSAEFSQIEHLNLYDYRAADVLALQQGVSFERMQLQLQQQAARAVPDATSPARERYDRDQALLILRSHPILALRSWIDGLARLLFYPGAMRLYTYLGHDVDASDFVEDLRRSRLPDVVKTWVAGRPLLFALAIDEGLLLLVGYAGLLLSLRLARRHRRARWRFHALWLGTLTYLVVVSSGPEAYARLRVPLVPILALGAGYWIARSCGMPAVLRRPVLRTAEREAGVPSAH